MSTAGQGGGQRLPTLGKERSGRSTLGTVDNTLRLRRRRLLDLWVTLYQVFLHGRRTAPGRVESVIICVRVHRLDLALPADEQATVMVAHNVGDKRFLARPDIAAEWTEAIFR